MSAGGLSYSGLTNYGKSTLPSVESWSSNMNILRDPPKSIYTRRIDKVGATSDITQMVEDSGGRINGLNEYIRVYPLSVNPMVAVDYSNFAKNGGQNHRGIASSTLSYSQGGGKQSFLPYRIMDKGAFRPPIRDQRSLLPLSRLPRVWTSSYTLPGFTDFSKKAMCGTPDIDTETKGVKNSEQMLRGSIKPTGVYQLETPVIEPFEVRYVIRNPEKIVTVPVHSGKDSKTRINGEMGEVTKEISNKIKADLNVNKNGKKKDGESSLSSDRFIHDRLQGEMNSKISNNIQTTSIDELWNDNNRSGIKDNFNIDYTTQKKGHEKVEYNHKEVVLERTTPIHEAVTNMGRNIHKPINSQMVKEYQPNRPTTSFTVNSSGGGVGKGEEFLNRNVRLKPTISGNDAFGGDQGFMPIGKKPVLYTENQVIEFDAQKSQSRKRVYDMQQERNVYLGNIPFSIQANPN